MNFPSGKILSTIWNHVWWAISSTNKTKTSNEWFWISVWYTRPNNIPRVSAHVYNVTHTLNSAELWFLVEKIFRGPKLSILVVWNTESSFNPLNTNPTKFQTHSKNLSSTADELFECVWPFCGVGAQRVHLCFVKGRQTGCWLDGP